MIVISFDTTSYAMKADKFFESTTVRKMVVPTPRAISQSCGISIRIEKKELETVKKLIQSNDLKIKGIYEVENNTATKIY